MNLELLGNLQSFNFLGEDHIVVASLRPSMVIVYDTEGDQLHTIGKHGEGPYEYLSPEIVRTFENNIYIFCRSLAKLMVFTVDGTPVREYINFSKGIKDFRIYKDRLYKFGRSGIQLFGGGRRKFRGR